MPLTNDEMTHPATAVVLHNLRSDGTTHENIEDTLPASPSIASPSLLQTSLIYISIAGTQLISSLSTGLIAMALPKMATDLSLSISLLLWPTAIYGLVSGCTLLPSGAIADVVGSRNIYLLGTMLMSITLLASGLARTSGELFFARGLQGLAVSLCLPAGVSLLTSTFPEGKRRNFGFALQGAAQPFGFSLGLFLGGFFVESVGWRWGWYIDAVGAALVVVVSAVCLPRKETDRLRDIPWRRLKTDVDWVGAALASLCLGCLSYVLATVAANGSSIKHPANIALLIIACLAAPSFFSWMSHQATHNKPALIPNHLWRKPAFSTICIMVLIAWAVINTFEYNFSLYVQQVQLLPAIQASIRFLPNILVGVALIPLWGGIMHKVPAYHIVLVAGVVTAVSPLLMAVTKPTSSYWFGEFWALLFSPIGADVIFVVANILTTSLFPRNMQSLAGAVFNTVCQFGQALGLAVMALIAASATNASEFAVKSSPEALLVGYRASYWACFGLSGVGCFVGAFGLRGIGVVGVKKD